MSSSRRERRTRRMPAATGDPTPTADPTARLCPAACRATREGYEIRLSAGPPILTAITCSSQPPSCRTAPARREHRRVSDAAGQPDRSVLHSVRVHDDGVPPKSAAGVLALQVSAPDACVIATCDAATGCAAKALPVTTSCCAQPPPERAAYVEAACPDGAVLFAGGNSRYGIGRLQDCDFLRVVNYLQSGATVRLNVEARCLRTDRTVRVRAIKHWGACFRHRPTCVPAAGRRIRRPLRPDLECLGPGALRVRRPKQTHCHGNRRRRHHGATQRRVILTFDTPADLIDPSPAAPGARELITAQRWRLGAGHDVGALALIFLEADLALIPHPFQFQHAVRCCGDGRGLGPRRAGPGWRRGCGDAAAAAACASQALMRPQ
jgi:hypothetical protein